MTNGPWTDQENDLIVADYFAMLAEDVIGRAYNKTAHRRSLMPLLQGRTEGSVEFKHQNISAVLKGLGEVWIPGYKPAFNFQMTLVDAVARWLAWNPAWLGRLPGTRPATALCEVAPLWVGPPPTLSNQPPPQELDQMQQVARKFDVAGRDERNRALGRAGEERVLAHERSALKGTGRGDLARKVRWVSQEDGDGAGYDIASFMPDGRARLIEVKTTNGWERTPFYISRNELAVADDHRSEWCLFRLWNFSREPKAFELFPPLDAHLSLTATAFQASFH
jgi:Protein NO VEIN, C-terminal